MSHKEESERYLNMYPELRKWIKECPVCHSKGYNPEMPDRIGGEHSCAARLRVYS